MPAVSRALVRVSLLYLITGMTFGALMLAGKGIDIGFPAMRLLSGHSEVILFGWLVQFVLGISYWLLPRYSSVPKRGNPVLSWSGFLIFNLGTLLLVAGALGVDGIGGAAARATQLFGVALLLVTQVPRIKAMECPSG